MGKIIELSEDIISKVAAGEVVERPASVIKELIENSIDAKATLIDISVEDAGLKRIRIIDNGEGMDEDDLKKCFKRYTTSKISSLEDLSFIKSLGFRGEALYSIASVSNLTIKSKPKENTAGFSLLVNNGEFVEMSPTGMPDGTHITIDNIFKNIPARKKFLKTPQTEFRHIVDVVSKYALSFTNIRFILSHNGKVILDLPKTKKLEDRVGLILGEEARPLLIPLNFKVNNFSIHGFISKPELCASKDNLYIFVNNRVVKHKLLASVVKDTYGSLLEPHSYPTAVLFFNVPYGMVDVNVHPRKEEVRFLDDKSILAFTEKAVKKTLEESNLLFEKAFSRKEKSYKSLATELKEASEPWSVKEVENSEILQINNLYLVTGSRKGLLLFDQHAAHEKILFDQFSDTFKNKKKEVAPLKKSVVINLSPKYSTALEEFLDFFDELGFEIGEFGRCSFKISTAPIIFHQLDLKKIIVETLDDLMTERKPKDIGSFAKKIISYLACRSAIKGGEYLTSSERIKLVQKVLESKSTYTCPHGRPVMIEVSVKELDKMFKRV